MKKLLFITAFPPNNRSGGQIFSLNTINDISKKYKVDLIYFNYKNQEHNNINANIIKIFNINNLNCLFKINIHPIFSRRFNKIILDYLNNTIKNYDVIFFDFTQTGIYSLYLKHPYKIIQCHDIMIQKFSRKNKIFKHWVKRTEYKILRSVNKIFVPSKKDADVVKDEYNIDVYYTYIHMKYFNFYKYNNNKHKIFIFYGLWSRSENTNGLLWFFKKVLPLIKYNNEIKFKIIGDGLPNKIYKKYILNNNNIEYLGFVDEPLKIIYESCAVISQLFFGAGVKVKVIDAFTTGTPVIGNEITFEGLPCIDKLMYRADKPEEYIKIINNILITPSEEKEKNAFEFKALYYKNHLINYL